MYYWVRAKGFFLRKLRRISTKNSIKGDYSTVSKNNPTKLSVIVPVSSFDNPSIKITSWVEEAVSMKIQVIIVHDKQDDFTPSYPFEISPTNYEVNVKIIENNYGSPGRARNAGLEVAVGEWIMFWDSDDLPNPRVVLDAIESVDSKIEICVGNFMELSILTGITRQQNTRSVFDVALNPGLWRIAFRKEILTKMLFCNALMGEDQLFLAEIKPTQRAIKFFQYNFYTYYKGHAGQLTSKKRSVSDLAIVMNKIGNMLLTASLREFFFLSSLLNRQFLTGLKNGSTRIRLEFIGVWLSIIWKVKILSKFILVYNFLYVLIRVRT